MVIYWTPKLQCWPWKRHRWSLCRFALLPTARPEGDFEKFQEPKNWEASDLPLRICQRCKGLRPDFVARPPQKNGGFFECKRKEWFKNEFPERKQFRSSSEMHELASFPTKRMILDLWTLDVRRSRTSASHSEVYDALQVLGLGSCASKLDVHNRKI